ncbi:MAG: endolytic transglycosylase MltG [Bdellovibrionota bacterium]
MRRIISALTILIVGGVLIVGYGYSRLEEWSHSKYSLSEPADLDYPKGTSLPTLAQRLQQANLIDNAYLFRLYVRSKGLYNRFQAGVYRFEESVSPDDIVKTITGGKTFSAIAAEYTIPEGFTIFQIRDRLVRHGIGDKESIHALLFNRSFIKSHKINSKSLEGYLYPATYKFHKKIPSAEEALETMIDEFFRRLPKDYQARAKKMGLSLNQAVTFASLVEKETSHEDEKPLVAEVIWRRLKRGEPIGIDAGLIYGIKNYDGDIKWKDLRDSKNPYNSRIHKGLPPTAIGATSISSLEAILAPSNYNYYYYVRKPGSENRHHFSRTLDEHNQYVKKLVRGN